MSGREPGGHLDEAVGQPLFQALLTGIDCYVSCIDRDRRILFLNRTLTRDMSEILGKQIDDFLSPEHRASAIAAVERAFQTGQPERVSLTTLLADGSKQHFFTRVVPFKGPDGEDLALQVTTDDGERQRLSQELERSLEFRRKVVENLPDFVALMDREHRYVWVNRLAPQLDHSDVIGSKLEAFVSAEGLVKAQAALDAAFEFGRMGYYEIEGYGDGHSSAWYGVRVAPVMTEGKVDSVLLVTSDITERKRAERALREKEELLHRAQRLESLGQLAGGIAHDFNNLLQVIEGNLSFVKESLEAGEDPMTDLEQAMRATERAGELTSHLLAVGRRSRVMPKRVDLGTLVEHSVRMLRRTIPENVKLSYEVPRTQCFVDVDPPQFEQVLINLCVNARDAMPQGGELDIEIAPEGASHVVMTVKDTGTGIATEHLNRIFEPFFTTKGAGSGLGLAVASGIIAAHGGDMTAASDGCSGTTMKVRLPRVASGTEETPAPISSSRPVSGVILVAEDEDVVRAQLQRVLERAGYRVLQANNGALAVELFRQHRDAVDLVLLDVVMPELDGWKAFLEMEALKPNIKVLFTTGYAASVLPSDFAARGARLISKPYKPQQLLAEVRDLIAQRLTP